MCDVIKQEKEEILRELQQQKQKISENIKNIEKDYDFEKKLVTQDQEKLVANFLHQKSSLEKEIENQESKLNKINSDISQQENNQESYEQIIYEKEQHLAYEKENFNHDLQVLRDSKYDLLEEDFNRKKQSYDFQIKQMRDKQDSEFSERLVEFEKDLSERRKHFELDLVNRRQKIIEECKRNQSIEFDNILSYEKDKHINQTQSLKNEVESLNIKLKSYKDEDLNKLKDYKKQLDDLQKENKQLQDDINLVQDQTRKNTIGSIEVKYESTLDTYKKKFQEEIVLLKKTNQTIDQQLKSKELLMKDYQIKIKRLESQLNQMLLNNKEMYSMQQNSPKVLRNKNGFRGI